MQLIQTKTICKRLKFANKKKIALIGILAIKSRLISICIFYIKNSTIGIY